MAPCVIGRDEREVSESARRIGARFGRTRSDVLERYREHGPVGNRSTQAVERLKQIEEIGLRARHAPASRARRPGHGGPDRARSSRPPSRKPSIARPDRTALPNLSHGQRVGDRLGDDDRWARSLIVVRRQDLGRQSVPNPVVPRWSHTLHCALPEPDCEASTSDRVLANRFIYHFPRSQTRRDRRLQHAEARATRVRHPAATFVKRLITACPATCGRSASGVVYINGQRLNGAVHPGPADATATRRRCSTSRRRNTYTRIPNGLLPDDGRTTGARPCDSPPLGPRCRARTSIGKVVF